MITSIIFDFDGVLGESRSLAWAAGCQIATAFGRATRVKTRADYRQAFGRNAQEEMAGPDGAATLREAHRLIMRAQATAIPRHESLLSQLLCLNCPLGIITAGYAQTVVDCLGAEIGRFRFIQGRESGSKADLLTSCRQRTFASPLYVGDTVSDIRLCQKVGIPICATGWPEAYDSTEDLAAAHPAKAFPSNAAARTRMSATILSFAMLRLLKACPGSLMRSFWKMLHT